MSVIRPHRIKLYGADGEKLETLSFNSMLDAAKEYTLLLAKLSERKAKGKTPKVHKIGLSTVHNEKRI